MKIKQHKMGDPQQKVGPLEWTEKVNGNKVPQNGVPPTQKMDLDWTTMEHKFLDFWIFGFVISWIFFFWTMSYRAPQTPSP